MGITITKQSFDARNAEAAAAFDAVRDAFKAADYMVSEKTIGGQRLLVVAGELIAVKNESKYARGSNLCIETFQGPERSASGLMVTAATVCVHWLGADCMAYRVEQMREWLQMQIRMRNYDTQMFGGSDHGNGGVIVKRNHLELSGAEFTYAGTVSGLSNSHIIGEQ